MNFSYDSADKEYIKSLQAEKPHGESAWEVVMLIVGLCALAVGSFLILTLEVV